MVSTLVDTEGLRSVDYVASTSGWMISGAGNVEFNNGEFRGALIAGEVHIPDEDTTANSFHTDTNGNSWWGCTSADFTSDNDNANAYILNTGVAKFQNVEVTGTINATAGWIGTPVALVYEDQGINCGASGHIRGGQTDFFTGDGFFLGYSTDDYKFSIGDTSNYMTWDGSYLKIKGSFDVGTGGIVNNAVYTVATLPIAPTEDGFNNPSAYE